MDVESVGVGVLFPPSLEPGDIGGGEGGAYTGVGVPNTPSLELDNLGEREVER